MAYADVKYGPTPDSLRRGTEAGEDLHHYLGCFRATYSRKQYAQAAHFAARILAIVLEAYGPTHPRTTGWLARYNDAQERANPKKEETP